MSTRHHHPGEGHGDGEPSRPARNHLHHNWFFYVAFFFILVALICFVLSSTPSLQPSPLPPRPASTDGGEK